MEGSCCQCQEGDVPQLGDPSAHYQPRKVTTTPSPVLLERGTGPCVSCCLDAATGQAWRVIHVSQLSCYFTLCWWDLTWSNASRCGVLSAEGTWSCWSVSRGGPQKWSKGWNTSPTRTGWESWNCSSWRREGSKVTWVRPFSIWRGSTRKKGTDSSAGSVMIWQGEIFSKLKRMDVDVPVHYRGVKLDGPLKIPFNSKDSVIHWFSDSLASVSPMNNGLHCGPAKAGVSDTVSVFPWVFAEEFGLPPPHCLHLGVACHHSHCLHWEQPAQDLMAFDIQGKTFHNIPGQPVPILSLLQCEEVLPDIQKECSVFQFVSIASCSATGHHWK